MADERMICSQQSNNWYQFVILPDTRKGLAFNATLVPSASAWYCLIGIRNAHVGEFWLSRFDRRAQRDSNDP